MDFKSRNKKKVLTFLIPCKIVFLLKKMFENEEPRHPPMQEKSTEALRIFPQVPEVTIISAENKQIKRNNTNFFHRTETSQKTSSQPLINPFYSISPRQQSDQLSAMARTGQKQINAQFRPQVPDLSILDDHIKKATNNSPLSSTERVFTESYKEMLVNSHEHFLKQLGKDNEKENSSTSSEKKRSPFLSTATFKQNPLSKYAPKAVGSTNSNINSQTVKDLNSSSILVDVKISDNLNKNNALSEESEEVTLKKVAEMLTEIQKLVIPSEKTYSIDSSSSDARNTKEILKQLANTYLTPEEVVKFQIEKEFGDADFNL